MGICGLNLGHDAGIAFLDRHSFRLVELERVLGTKHVCGAHEGVTGAVAAETAGERQPIEAVALVDYYSPNAGLVPKAAARVVSGSEWRIERSAMWRSLPAGTFRLPGLADAETCLVRHHYAHAALSYFTSSFSRALVVCLDGVGAYSDCGIVCLGRGDELQAQFFLNNAAGPRFGLLYEACARRIFGGPFDTGKMMALAGFGRPVERLITPLRALLAGNAFRRTCPTLLEPLDERGLVGTRVVLSGRAYPYSPERGGYLEPAMETYDDVLRLHARDFPQEIAGLAIEFDSSTQACRDLAATVQHVFVEELLSFLRGLRAAYGETALCLGGGCALNVLANRRIAEESGFEQIHVPSCCNDSGVALGAAMALRPEMMLRRRDGSLALELAFSGTPCRGLDRLEGLVEQAVAVGELWLERHDPRALAARTAGLLAGGSVLGWIAGRCEAGPRALGHRSLLASPLVPGMRRRVSEQIKGRESFRPVAPMCLRAAAPTYFAGPLDRTETMLFSVSVHPAHSARLEEVLHVDGSARLQTIGGASDDAIEELLACFGELTGVPILINTSLNGRGRPMLNSVEEALDLLRCSPMDGIAFVDAGTLVLKNARGAT